MAEVLVGLGGLSLVAAVVVFAAVTWSDLAAWAQGGLLVALTALVAGGAVACRRQGLGATAEALAAVTVALAVADVHVARVGLAAVVDPRAVWAVGLAVVAGAAWVAGRRTGLRTLALAGAALAFLPAVVAAQAGPSASVLVAVLAAQALAAIVVLDAVGDRRLERAAIGTGAVLCWLLAAFGALVLAGAGLANDPPHAPLGAAALLATLAAGSVLLGRQVGRPGLGAAGVALGFAPAILVAAPVGSTLLLWVLVGQACAGLVLSATLLDPDRTADPDRRAPQVAARTGTITTWLVAALGALLVGADALIGEPVVPVGAVAVALALAAVAVGAALWARWGRDATATALVVAVITLLGGIALAQGTRDADIVVTTVALAAGALALGLALLVTLDRDRPWTAPFVVAGATVAALALVPLQSVLTVLAALADVSLPPSDGSVGQSLVDRLSSSAVAVDSLLPTATTLLGLASVALLGGGLLLLRRRVGVAVLAATGIAATVVAPVVAGLAVGPTALGLSLLVVAIAVVLVSHPDDPTAMAAGTVLVPVLLAVSAASAPLAVGATVLVTAAATGLAVLALLSGRASAAGWVGAALVTTLGGVVLDAVLLGATGSGPVLALAATALIASAVGPAIERWCPTRAAGPASVTDGVVAGALAVALVTSQSLDAASAVVAAVSLGAGLAALRPGRRHLWVLSLAAAVVVVWMRLASASVGVVEAYTLPLAAALLATGLLVRRGEERSSWARVGAALVALLVPSAVLAVTELDPTRTAAVVVAAVAVTLWGAVRREQAPLALGGVVVAAVAVRHLGPVAADLPRWTVLAAAGIVLLATGATFEQRRRDLRAARDAFSRLG